MFTIPTKCDCAADDCRRCHPELQAAVACGVCGESVPKYGAASCRRCDGWVCHECMSRGEVLCGECKREEEEDAT